MVGQIVNLSYHYDSSKVILWIYGFIELTDLWKIPIRIGKWF
jgi:hypothetical protein